MLKYQHAFVWQVFLMKALGNEVPTIPAFPLGPKLSKWDFLFEGNNIQTCFKQLVN